VFSGGTDFDPFDVYFEFWFFFVGPFFHIGDGAPEAIGGFEFTWGVLSFCVLSGGEALINLIGPSVDFFEFVGILSHFGGCYFSRG